MDYLSGIWQEIVARPDGPMSFRVYLQPVMSTIYAIISGLKDAREGQPAYFWSMFTDPTHRAELVRDGWKSVRNVFLLAIGMDLVYQITVLKGLRPMEGLIVAVDPGHRALPPRSWPGQPSRAVVRRWRLGWNDLRRS